MLRSSQLIRNKSRKISFHIHKFKTSQNECRESAVLSVHSSSSQRNLASASFSSSSGYNTSNGPIRASSINGQTASYKANGQATESDIIDFCTSVGLDIREQSETIAIKECPFCHETRGEASNQYKLGIKIDDGCYNCFRCGAKGSWKQFQEKMSTRKYQNCNHTKKNASMHSNSRKRRIHGPNSSRTERKSTAPKMPKPHLAEEYKSNLMKGSPQAKKALDYLVNERGLLVETLKKYSVGMATYQYRDTNGYVPSDSITFPWIVPAAFAEKEENIAGTPTVLRRIKARSLERKDWQRMHPSGGGLGLFGYDTIPCDAKEIIITEGEYDAMAVSQATGRPSVSLPNGTGSKLDQLMTMIEPFQKIYLWMDNDNPGQAAAKKIAAKIGITKCFIVKPTGSSAPKDANEALLMNLNLDEIINDAQLMQHENVTNFKTERAKVIEEMMNPNKYKGIGSESFPGLTNIVKGFRKGEMTIVTGPTGSGKTTFLSQLSIDFAEQDKPVLWGSFEIKNTRLMQKMMRQYHKKPYDHNEPNSLDVLNKMADNFEKLPFGFLTFHGGTHIDEVMDAMELTVKTNGVEHIIIDNLQFMLTPNPSANKFDMQDEAISKFRRFATEKNIHLILVVHPRKEKENKLDIDSIYGGAKVTQEADLVLILQSDKTKNSKYIDVRKNRYDGTLGYSNLSFDQSTLRYQEASIVGTPSGMETPINLNPVTSQPLSSTRPSMHSENESVDSPWSEMFQK